MKLEDLAELSGPALAKLTDSELEAILSPYYKVTRPEMVERKSPQKKEEVNQMYLDPRKRAALELLKESGVDVSFINRKKR